MSFRVRYASVLQYFVARLMSNTNPDYAVHCRNCDHVERAGYNMMLRELRALGSFRKIDKPEPEMVQELFFRRLEFIQCAKCDQATLEISEEKVADREWGQANACERCKKPIPPERLEIFPETTRCAQCQDSASSSEIEYCERCGGLMTVQQSSRGISRYIAMCSECGLRH